MGSPVSPIVANKYMKEFDKRHSTQLTIHPKYGKDMWVTLLPCRTLNARRNTYTTYRPYSSQ